MTVFVTHSLGVTNSYAIGKMDAGVAQAAFSRIDRPDIDALVIPGGNFPTMESIAPWERQFGKPVITTNQATLWAVMRTMQIDTSLAGKGRLLEEMPTEYGSHVTHGIWVSCRCSLPPSISKHHIRRRPDPQNQLHASQCAATGRQ